MSIMAKQWLYSMEIQHNMSGLPCASSFNIVPQTNHLRNFLGWFYGGSVILSNINKCGYWLTSVSLQGHTSNRIRLLVYSIGLFLLATMKIPTHMYVHQLCIQYIPTTITTTNPSFKIMFTSSSWPKNHHASIIQL